MSDILPCPVCGKPGTLRSNPRLAFVRCEDPLCLFAPERLFADDAIAVWNRLASGAADVGRLRARLKNLARLAIAANDQLPYFCGPDQSPAVQQLEIAARAALTEGGETNG